MEARRQPPPVPPRPAAAPVPLVIAALGAIMLIGAASLFGAGEVGGPGSFASGAVLAIAVLTLTTVLALRRPRLTLISALAVAAFSGTLGANTNLPVRPLVWLLLGGLVVATLVSHVVAVRSQRLVLWPGIVALGVFFAYALANAPFADTWEIGWRAFGNSFAGIAVFFAVAYARWRPETRWRISRALVVLAAVVGAYALFRLIVGPTDAEEAIPRFAFSAGETPDDPALFASFSSRTELGGWCAIMIPFTFAFALAVPGRWRLLAGVGFALLIVALLGSQVRVSLVAAATGVVLALALYQLSSAFKAAKLGTVTIAAIGILAAGGIAYATVIADSPRQVERYEQILEPGSDYSFQRRLRKWREAVSEINESPYGQGLGTAGNVQRSDSEVIRLDNFYIDNSYLQLGVQLGYPGMILFGTSAILLLYLLVRSSVMTTDRRGAAVGIGASASLLAWLVDLLAGGNLETWGALLLWVVAGLGASYFVSASSIRRPSPVT